MKSAKTLLSTLAVLVAHSTIGAASAQLAPSAAVSACLTGVTPAYSSTSGHEAPSDFDLFWGFIRTGEAISMKFCYQVDGKTTLYASLQNGTTRILSTSLVNKVNSDDSSNATASSIWGTSNHRYDRAITAGKRSMRVIFSQDGKVVRDNTTKYLYNTTLDKRLLLAADVRKDISVKSADGKQSLTNTLLSRGAGKAYVVIKEFTNTIYSWPSFTFNITYRIHGIKAVPFANETNDIPGHYLSLDEVNSISTVGMLFIDGVNDPVKVGKAIEIPAPKLTAEQQAMFPYGFAWGIDEIRVTSSVL